MSQGDNVLKAAADLARKQKEAEEHVAKCEEQLAGAKADLKKIKERDFPEFMIENEMTTFTTSDGLSISVVEGFSASISKANRPVAHKFLRENDCADIIKNTVAVEFGKDENEEADNFEEELAKKGLVYNRDEKVHPSTLKKTIKELMEDGVEINEKIFGVFWRKETVVEQTE